MRIPLRLIGLLFGGSLPSFAAAQEHSTGALENPAAAAITAEMQEVEAIYLAVRRDDDDAADARTVARGQAVWAGKPSSVFLARRTALVCAWLTNENERGRAMRLAERSVRRLANLKEENAVDRVERLYWEAWLVGELLDRKTQAIALLREAEALAPEDERVIKLQLRLVNAVVEFGR